MSIRLQGGARIMKVIMTTLKVKLHFKLLSADVNMLLFNLILYQKNIIFPHDLQKILVRKVNTTALFYKCSKTIQISQKT